MAFSGPFRELLDEMRLLRAAAQGKFANEARELAGEVAYREAVEGWRAGRSPYGERWIGAKGRALTLQKSGALFRSMERQRTPFGFRIIVGGPDFGRHALSTILEYGGRILAGKTREYAIRAQRARKAAVRAGIMSWSQVSDYSKKRTEKAMARLEFIPMTFRINGQWRSARGVLIRPAPMLPRRKNEIPPVWEKAIVKALEELAAKRLGKG